MSARAASHAASRGGTVRRPWVPKALRYAGGSVVATVCSEVAFVLLYGVLHVSTGWSSVVSWLAGALPNYWLNRRWAWQRTDRPSLRREILPYAAIVGLTLLIATVVTHAADHALRSAGMAHSVRVALVAAAFFGVYVIMFVLRFFLFDRLFTWLAKGDADRTDGSADRPADRPTNRPTNREGPA